MSNRRSTFAETGRRASDGGVDRRFARAAVTPTRRLPHSLSTVGPMVTSPARPGAQSVMGLGLPSRPLFMEDHLSNKDDATKLTAFPTPGDPRRRPVVQFVWDGSDEDSKEPSKARRKRGRRRVSDDSGGVVPTGVVSGALNLDQKHYWMPDKLCKVCYECDTPFTMFRRRHHCRVCGQIFCNNCSSNRVDGRPLGINGSIRMCMACAEQLNVSRKTGRRLEPALQRSEDRLGQHSRRKRDTGASSDLGSVSASLVGEGRRVDAPVLGSKRGVLVGETREEGDAVSGAGGVGGKVGGGVVQRTGSRSDPAHEGFLDTLRANAESPEETEEARVALELAAVARLERMVRQLVAANSDIDPSRKAEWSRIVATLVQQAVSTVDPNVKTGDHLDIRPYVKTKLIPGGRREECRYVDGLVFRKNVTHKTMPRVIERPRLLVLSGGIDFQRSDRTLANLDKLLEAEQRYIQILVDKIAALGPQLLLVGKTVNHYAQLLLRDRRIALIQNIKPITLYRIARLVGATVLPSVDHINRTTHGELPGASGSGANPSADRSEMGVCARFSVVTFASPSLEECVAKLRAHGAVPPEGDRVAEGDLMRSWVPETFRRVRGRGGVTYVFLEGCHERLGCTLVLRGGSAAELKAVKRVVWLAVNVAYNLRLEVSYLNDRRACLLPSISSSQPSTALTNAGLQVGSVASSTFSSAPSSAAVNLASGASAASSVTAVRAQSPETPAADATVAASVEVSVGSDSRNDVTRDPETLAVPVAPAAPTAASGNGGGGAVGIASIGDHGASANPTNSNATGSAVTGEGGATNISSSNLRETSDASRKQAENAGGLILASSSAPSPSPTPAAAPALAQVAVEDSRPLLSSSLGVDFGHPPVVRGQHPGSVLKASSGGRSAEKGATNGLWTCGGEHFAFLNQNLIITHVWMTHGAHPTQCCPADVQLFDYYTKDTALGQFLVDNCFNPSFKCPSITCKRSAQDHVLSFVHNNGRVDITVSWLQFDLAAAVEATRVWNAGEVPPSEDSSAAYTDEYESDSEFNDGVASRGEGTSHNPGSASPSNLARRFRKDSVSATPLNGAGGIGVDDGTSSTASTFGALMSPGLCGTSLRLRGDSNAPWRGSGSGSINRRRGSVSSAMDDDGIARSSRHSVSVPSQVGESVAGGDAASKAAADSPIYMWSVCKKCGRTTTPLVPMSEDTWKFSLGKFLEVTYYNRLARPRGAKGEHCGHSLLQDHALKFASGKLVAEFNYQEIQPYSVFIRTSLPFESNFNLKSLDSLLRSLADTTTHLFRQFDKGLAKILDITTESDLRQLQEEEVCARAISAVHHEALELRMELAAKGLDLLVKLSRSPRLVAQLPVARRATSMLYESVQHLLPPQSRAVSASESVGGDVDVSGGADTSSANPSRAATKVSSAGAPSPATAVEAVVVAKATVRVDGAYGHYQQAPMYKESQEMKPRDDNANAREEAKGKVDHAVSSATAKTGGRRSPSPPIDAEAPGKLQDPLAEALGDETVKSSPSRVETSVEAAAAGDEENGRSDGVTSQSVAGDDKRVPVAGDGVTEVPSGEAGTPPATSGFTTGNDGDVAGSPSEDGCKAAPPVAIPVDQVAPSTGTDALGSGLAIVAVSAEDGVEHVDAAVVSTPVAANTAAPVVKSQIADSVVPRKSSSAVHAVPAATAAVQTEDVGGGITATASSQPTRPSSADVAHEKSVAASGVDPPRATETVVTIPNGSATQTSKEHREPMRLPSGDDVGFMAAASVAVAAINAAVAAGTGVMGGISGRALPGASELLVYLTRFRRDIYWKACHWNDRLMATGQLLTTLKKVSDKRVSRSRGSRDSGPDRHAEELIQKAINRLHKVKEGARRGDGDDPDDDEDRAEVEQAIYEMVDEVDMRGEVSATLDGVIEKVEEHYEVYRVVEDLLQSVELRAKVGGLLTGLLAVMEDRITADEANTESTAGDAATAASVTTSQGQRRPSRELRRLFSTPRLTPTANLLNANSSSTGASRATAIPYGTGTKSRSTSNRGGSETNSSRSSRILGSRRTTRSTTPIRGASSTAKSTGGNKGVSGQTGGTGGNAGGSGSGSAGGAGTSDRGRMSSTKLSRRSSPLFAGDDSKSSARRSSDQIAPPPSLRARGGGSGVPRSGDLSDVGSSFLRKRPPLSAGTGGGGGGGGSTASVANAPTAGTSSTRVAQQRSRSRSSSPSTVTGNDSPPESPRARSSTGSIGTSARGRRTRERGSLEGSRNESSLGIASGRPRSGSSPRVSLSPRSSIGISRSPSPQRSRIPRYRGSTGGTGDSVWGSGGSMSSSRTTSATSASFRRRKALTPPSLTGEDPGATSDSSVAGTGGRSGAGEEGTLSGSAIDSVMYQIFPLEASRESTPRKKSEGAAEADGDGNGAVTEVAASAAGYGGEVSGRRSRTNSFESVGDVVVVGGVELERHPAFPGDAFADDDWLASQPGTPIVTQAPGAARMYDDDDDGKESVVDDLPAGNNASSAGGSGGHDVGQDIGDGNSNRHPGRAGGTDSAVDSAAGSTTGSPQLGLPKVSGEGSRTPANHSSGASRKQLSSTTGSKAMGSSRNKKPTPFPSMNIQTALARIIGGVPWGIDSKDWTVPLGPFEEGRPRLEPGRKGEFVLVFENQPTTIIAYSLSSHEYYASLQHFYHASSSAFGGGPVDFHEDRGPQMSNVSVGTTAIPGSPVVERRGTHHVNSTSGSLSSTPGQSAPGAVLTTAGGSSLGGASAAIAGASAAVVAGTSTSHADGGGVGGAYPGKARHSYPPGSPPLFESSRRVSRHTTSSLLGESITIEEGRGVVGVSGGAGGAGAGAGTAAGGGVVLSLSSSVSGIVPVVPLPGAGGGGAKLDETWWVMNDEAPESSLTRLSLEGASSVAARSTSAGMASSGLPSSNSVSGGVYVGSERADPSEYHRTRSFGGESGSGAGSSGFVLGGGDAVVTPGGAGSGPADVGDRHGVRDSNASVPVGPRIGKVLGRRALLETPGASELEAQLRSPEKTHIKHRFTDVDAKSNTLCKFVCHTLWATQFRALRRCYFADQRSSAGSPPPDFYEEEAYEEMEEGFIRSLSMASKWDAKGGKSGATFSKTADERFVIKYVTKTELQMFSDCALQYFKYMAKVFFHKMPTVLCKIVGVYEIGYHNKVTGKRLMEQVVVMQNIFYQRNISIVFDLKGSSRSRYIRVEEGQQPVASTSGNTTSASASTSRASTGGSGAAAASTSSASSVTSVPSNSAADPSASGIGGIASAAGAGASAGGGVSSGAGSGPVSGGGVPGQAAASAPAGSASTGGGSPGGDDIGGNRRAAGDASTGGGEGATGAAATGGSGAVHRSAQVLLDENFLEYTTGRPLPMRDEGKAVFHTAILNDTLFLHNIKIVDYSIVVGLDQDKRELVVGIIDYMRQYDIIKRMERMGKSVSMIAGQAEPTIVQPSQYKARFQQAMDRYFMTVPDKWTGFAINGLRFDA